MTTTLPRAVLLSLAAVMLSIADSSPADACGGAFFASETVSVKGHQMAVSISKQQTVVWDRVEMSGRAEEFAYVVPLRKGARLELASEKFFLALDAKTAPTVNGPSHGGCQSGCLGGCGNAGSDTAGGSPQVTVVERKTAGPYESVHLRTTEPDALPNWLRANGFKIPDAVGPTIDAYVAEGFDFVALKLRPGAEGASLQPLRLVTPGADPTLPLRMSRAGVSDRAAISLYVIGEGRWRLSGFKEERVDDDKLLINPSTEKSNYHEAVEAQLRAADGRTSLIEASLNVTRCGYGYCPSGIGIEDPPCSSDPIVLAGGAFEDGGTSASDAGKDASDAASFDGGNDAASDAAVSSDGGGAGDAGDASTADADVEDEDASVPDQPTGKPAARPPCGKDDWELASSGLDERNVWITRLRLSLPASAFDTDLRFEANPEQIEVRPYHRARESGGGASVTSSHPSAFGGSIVTWLATLAGLAWLVGRRRRQ